MRHYRVTHLQPKDILDVRAKLPIHAMKIAAEHWGVPLSTNIEARLIDRRGYVPFYEED